MVTPVLANNSVSLPPIAAAEAPSASGARFSEVLHPSRASTPGAEAAFEKWWQHIPRLEGTLEQWKANPHNAADRGGRTHYGITERAFMGCAGAAGLPKTPEAFENMSASDAKKIAKAIWKTSGALRIEDPGVATAVGDWFWGSNTGAWSGVKSTLSVLGAGVGAGPGLDEKTIAALNVQSPDRLVHELSLARGAQHERIAGADASQGVFLNGWQNRVAFIEAHALSLVATEAPDRDAPPPTAPYRIPV